MSSRKFLKLSFSISADERAQTLCRSCFADVRRNLQSAAVKWRSDDENVHQLRIAVRRAMVCLDLFEWPRDSADIVKWLQKKLMALLKAAGRARDLDVLSDKQLAHAGKAAARLEKAWMAKREDCQNSLQKLCEKLVVQGQLKSHVRSLLKSGSGTDICVNDSSRKLTETEWGKSRLDRMLKTLIDGIPRKPDPEHLHKFRIAVKQVRYTVELLHGSIPSLVAADLLDVLSAVQKRLGRLQDEQLAVKAFGKFLRQKAQQPHASKLRKLSKRKQACIVAEIPHLLTWIQEEVRPRICEIWQRLSAESVQKEHDAPQRIEPKL